MRHKSILIGMLAATAMISAFQFSGRALAIPPWADPSCVLRTYQPAPSPDSVGDEGVPGLDILHDDEGVATSPPEGVVLPPSGGIESPPPEVWAGIPGMRIIIVDAQTYYTCL